MPKVKISELPSATGFSDDDIVPLVDETGTVSATTKRGNIAQLRNHIQDTTDVGDLSDVNTSGATDGQTLAFDSGSGTWIPQNPGGGAAALNDLTDVNTAGQAAGEVLAYSGSAWVPVPFSDYNLDDLGDVDTSGLSDGDVLTFNDATDTWEAMAPVGGTNALDDLTDVNTTGVSTGDFLMYSGGTWVDRTLLFDDISDVNLSGANNGDFLQRQSGVWVDRTFVFDDISDVDLTSANNGDFLQRQSGVWVDRTLVFDDISDVDLAGAADGDFLRRTAGVWVDHDLVISDATDVDTSGASDGEVLTYDSGQWISQIPTGGITELNDIPDVDTTGVSDGDVLTFDTGSGDWIAAPSVGGGSGGPTSSYWDKMAATLEPLALEEIQVGTFSYTVTGGEVKMLMSAWSTQIGGASGRLDIRDVRNPHMPWIPLHDIALTGVESQSMAMVIDPSLATYTDPMEVYYDRLNLIAESKVKKIVMPTENTHYPLLPGAYGAIIVGATGFNYTWLAITSPAGTFAGLPFTEEIGDDGSTEYYRYGRAMTLPVSKYVCNGILTGQDGGTGDADGTTLYVLCDEDWGHVADGTSYTFRDDFMGASLDTSTVWSRTQSSGGNVEIDTNFGWLKIIGNSNWNANGLFSQTSVTRQSGRVFLVDMFVLNGVVAKWGFHDGSGVDATDFPNSFICASWAGPTAELHVQEGASGLGQIGTVTENCTYRFRITLGGSNAATYEIQGGAPGEYPAIGGSSWDNVTPGGSGSNSTSPLRAGATIHTGTGYFGDMRMYG